MANFCTHGSDAYSYDTCIRTMNNDAQWILNVTKYSKTTTRHQAEAFQRLFAEAIKLDNVPRGATADDLRALASKRALCPVCEYRAKFGDKYCSNTCAKKDRWV